MQPVQKCRHCQRVIIADMVAAKHRRALLRHVLHADKFHPEHKFGTVVLPDAELKIYLDAGVEERARRRQGELREQGKTEELSEVMEKIRQRDEADKTREHSPLRMANDSLFRNNSFFAIKRGSLSRNAAIVSGS